MRQICVEESPAGEIVIRLAPEGAPAVSQTSGESPGRAVGELSTRLQEFGRHLATNLSGIYGKGDLREIFRCIQESDVELRSAAYSIPAGFQEMLAQLERDGHLLSRESRAYYVSGEPRFLPSDAAIVGYELAVTLLQDPLWPLERSDELERFLESRVGRPGSTASAIAQALARGFAQCRAGLDSLAKASKTQVGEDVDVAETGGTSED